MPESTSPLIARGGDVCGHGVPEGGVCGCGPNCMLHLRPVCSVFVSFFSRFSRVCVVFLTDFLSCCLPQFTLKKAIDVATAPTEEKKCVQYLNEPFVNPEAAARFVSKCSRDC